MGLKPLNHLHSTKKLFKEQLSFHPFYHNKAAFTITFHRIFYPLYSRVFQRLNSLGNPEIVFLQKIPDFRNRKKTGMSVKLTPFLVVFQKPSKAGFLIQNGNNNFSFLSTGTTCFRASSSD
jgi:hypothetical protein